MDKTTSAGITRETCGKTRISYYQRLLTTSGAAGTCPGLAVFINGIGLDQEAFLPFLQLISLPSVRLTYPYKTFAHVAPTVPGFAPEERRRGKPATKKGEG